MTPMKVTVRFMDGDGSREVTYDGVDRIEKEPDGDVALYFRNGKILIYSGRQLISRLEEMGSLA